MLPELDDGAAAGSAACKAEESHGGPAFDLDGVCCSFFCFCPTFPIRFSRSSRFCALLLKNAGFAAAVDVLVCDAASLFASLPSLLLLAAGGTAALFCIASPNRRRFLLLVLRSTLSAMLG